MTAGSSPRPVNPNNETVGIADFWPGGFRGLRRDCQVTWTEAVDAFWVATRAVQWASMALGGYGVFSWAQSLSVRDKPLHALTWGTPTFLQAVGAGTLISFGSYAVGAWIFIYAFRSLGATPKDAGIALGLGSALGGWIGTSLGGIIGDRLKLKNPSGRLWLTLAASAIPVPIALYAYSTQDLTVFYVCYFLVVLLGTFWLGGITATMQDLVLPRMRGSAGAMFFMGTTLIGLGNGPYFVGLLSDATGDLRLSILATYLGAPIVWVLLLFAIKGLPKAETSRVERVRPAGEVI